MNECLFLFSIIQTQTEDNNLGVLVVVVHPIRYINDALK